MQPQGPYGSYNPNGQPPGPLYPPGQPQPPQPGPGGAVGPQPQLPGQPPIPAYQMPQARRGADTQTSLPPPPAAPTTPYDFFMQPKPPQPMMPLPASGKRIVGSAPRNPNSAKKTRIIFVAAIGVAVVILLGIGSAFLPKDQTGLQLLAVAQVQQEVVRVCAQGSSATFQSTRNFAATCSASVGTDQTDLLTYMNKNKYVYKPKELGFKANAATDAKLKAATASSTFDNTFRDLIKSQLAAYDRSLKGQLAITTGANARQLLNRSERNNSLLLLMVADESNKALAPSDSGN